MRVHHEHPDAFASFLAAFRTLLDANGLKGTIISRDPTTLAVSREGTQATDADRAFVIAWAADRSETSVTVSDIIDLQELL